MHIQYKTRKWLKEVENFKRFKTCLNEKFNNNELNIIEEFKQSGCLDYLRLYNCLAGDYRCMSEYHYLNNSESDEFQTYIFLSGLASLVTLYLHKKGVKTKYNQIVIDSLNNIDYSLFQLIAVDKVDNVFIKNEEDNLIMLMYNQEYDKAKMILDNLPEIEDVQNEIYYIKPVFLKEIYRSIIEQNEDRFNECLANRIKKYRKNMVGYSTIIDIASVALIKMAEKEGIHCTVDVIEIPKLFFDKTHMINKDEVKLPYYDEFLGLKLR